MKEQALEMDINVEGGAPIKPAEVVGRKHFVLDTNVLLHNPNAIFRFDEHEVVIPLTVIEELDRFKKNNDETGRNARQVIRALDELRSKGRLFEGVNWNTDGGTVRIDRCDRSQPFALDLDHADNRILGVAHALHASGCRTIFISKDINARVKCDALGIPCEDFEADRIDTDWLFEGYVEIQVDGALIDELYQERQLQVSRLGDFGLAEQLGQPNGLPELSPNQFLVLHDAADESHTGLARLLSDTGHLIPVTGPRKPVFGIMARNLQQTMALDLLLDDEIKLITMIGPAGTGKTLLALAAGRQTVIKSERFDHLLSTRGSHLNDAESRTAEQRLDRLMATGQVVLEPITYIRGRSIPLQFMVVDEAQNLSPHEVRTIVSRVGEGTKIVLCGDIGQIDSPYLDSSSNGLTHVIDRMRHHPIAGHVSLNKTERSELARISTEIL
jgi:PhoH-like ATPase